MLSLARSPWICNRVKPTTNHIASGQNGVLLTDPQEMDARQAKQQMCTTRFQECHCCKTFFILMEGKVELTEAVRRAKNIFWMERKVKRTLSHISRDRREPLVDNTSCL